MTHEQEMLSRAMNYVDDDLILAAHSPRKAIRRILPTLVAACCILALIISFPYLRAVINTNSDLINPGNKDDAADATPGKPDEEIPNTPKNIPVALGETTLTLTDTTETTATLTLVKKDNTPVYAILYDRRHSALASTEPNYKDNGVLIRPNTIRLYVNGEDQPTYKLPTAPGTYEIVVDFTSIRNGPYPMQECLGFYAHIGKDDKAVSILFSLEVEKETVNTDTRPSESDTFE
ncbi:MAG: hypothetical protein E7610_01850 [Ruminococcaceae bacterium]|nr:hypothetical protein [Oscillospiraceae bacterium]